MLTLIRSRPAVPFLHAARLLKTGHSKSCWIKSGSGLSGLNLRPPASHSCLPGQPRPSSSLLLLPSAVRSHSVMAQLSRHSAAALLQRKNPGLCVAVAVARWAKEREEERRGHTSLPSLEFIWTGADCVACMCSCSLKQPDIISGSGEGHM